MRHHAVAVPLAALTLAGGVAVAPAALAAWTATDATTLRATASTLGVPGAVTAASSGRTQVRLTVGQAPSSGPAPDGYTFSRNGSTACGLAATLPASCTVSSLLPGTTYSFAASSTLGRWSSDAASVTVTTDAPAAPATAPALAAGSDTGSSSSDGVTAVPAPTVTGNAGTANAGGTATLRDGSTPVGTGTVAADGSYAVTASALSDGPHTLTVVVSFGGGTASPASPARSVTIDTAAPVVSLGCPPAVGNGHRNVFSGSESDNGRDVTVTVAGAGTVTLTAAAPTGGTWTVTSTVNQLPRTAPLTAVASQTDVAGNTGSSAACTFSAA